MNQEEYNWHYAYNIYTNSIWVVAAKYTNKSFLKAKKENRIDIIPKDSDLHKYLSNEYSNEIKFWLNHENILSPKIPLPFGYDDKGMLLK